MEHIRQTLGLPGDIAALKQAMAENAANPTARVNDFKACDATADPTSGAPKAPREPGTQKVSSCDGPAWASGAARQLDRHEPVGEHVALIATVDNFEVARIIGFRAQREWGAPTGCQVGMGVLARGLHRHVCRRVDCEALAPSKLDHAPVASPHRSHAADRVRGVIR